MILHTLQYSAIIMCIAIHCNDCCLNIVSMYTFSHYTTKWLNLYYELQFHTVYLRIIWFIVLLILIFPYEISSHQIQSKIAILHYTQIQCAIWHWLILFDLFHSYEVGLKVCTYTYVCYFFSVSTIHFCAYWCQFKATKFVCASSLLYLHYRHLLM